MAEPYAAYQGTDRFAFICYAHADQKLVWQEIAMLNANGINVWYDEGISAGKNWRTEIGESLQRASWVVYFISRSSLASEHCNREINFALDEGTPIIPVYLEEIELTTDLRIGLGRVQALYLQQGPRYQQQLLSALDASDNPQTTSKAQPPSTAAPRRLRLVAAAFALLILAGLAGWWLVDGPSDPSLDAQTPAVANVATPSIAVMPFRDTGNAVSAGFADGMTDDLITDLSQVSQLFVVARNSAFAFEDSAASPADIAAQLNVRYVLEGSVRIANSTLRVNAQLIDTQTGNTIWAERVDGVVDNPLALQDRVAQSVVSALQLQMSDRELEAVAFKHTDDARAREHFQRGWALYRENTPRTFKLALEQFDAAVERDPDYLRAHAARAALLQASLSRDFTVKIGAWTRTLERRPDQILPDVLTSLRKASARPSALTFQVASQLALWRSNFDDAIAAAQAAISLAPNDPLGFEALSAAQTMSGQATEGIASIEQAMRLDPAYPNEYLFWHGLALFGTEQYNAAITPLELSFELNSHDDRVLIVLAAAYGQLGRTAEATRIVGMLNNLQSRREDEHSDDDPDAVILGIDVQLDGRYTLASVDIWQFKHVADRERLRTGLRMGGLPESTPEDNPIPFEVAGASTVDREQARDLVNQGVMVVDVRGMSDRNIGYIPGSVALNLKDSDDFNEANLKKLVAPDQPVLFHCEGMG